MSAAYASKNGRFIQLASYISKWSCDPNGKVGAVILSKQECIVALGYNAFPNGIAEDCRMHNKNLKNNMIIHAEQNALICAGERAMDGTIYVYGKPICPRCAALLIQCGVKRVFAVMPDPTEYPKSDSHRDGLISIDMFREAGLEFTPIP